MVFFILNYTRYKEFLKIVLPEIVKMVFCLFTVCFVKFTFTDVTFIFFIMLFLIFFRKIDGII